MFICPLCQEPLSANPSGLSCPANHQFDRAKEGYVHLLPVQHKGSKLPGDSQEMLLARRQFLDQGHYLPLRDLIQQRLQSLLSDRKGAHLLDLGCGEGYYTTAWRDCAAHISAIDVSKLAIKAAAKRYSGIEFCVASGYRLPIADGALDAVVRIYAPSKAQELARVIGSGGYLVTVTPGPRHLYQFKQLIYQQVQLHPEREHPLPEFELHQQERLSFTMELSAASARDLLQMTPFAWRATAEVWRQLVESDPFCCEADFDIKIWKRK